MPFFLQDKDKIQTFQAFKLNFKYLPIKLFVNGTLIKRHDILRERARLVREDILDLTEFLIERSSACLGRQILLVIVHIDVPIDPQTLYGPYELHAHVQRNRHDRIQNDQIGQEDEHGNDGGTLIPLTTHKRLPRQVLLKIGHS